MIEHRAKEVFWRVVEHCLVEIHGLSYADAHKMSTKLRERIESPPTGMSSEVFYHAEPFDVACDLANSQLQISEYRSRYDRILNHHNW